MPSKYFSHSLPYRRLQKFANGIWDEERKTFYPFKVANATVPAKNGISYYVYSANVSCYNNGDKNAAYCLWSAYVNGASFNLVIASVNTTVAAANVNACSSNSAIINVLCDVNKALTLNNSGPTLAFGNIIYAEIPADPAGGPVVIS